MKEAKRDCNTCDLYIGCQLAENCTIPESKKQEKRDKCDKAIKNNMKYNLKIALSNIESGELDIKRARFYLSQWEDMTDEQQICKISNLLDQVALFREELKAELENVN